MTGTTSGNITGTSINYLDVNKTGTYIAFENIITNNILLSLDSLPGNITYNTSNYDDVRSLIGNSIYIVNNSNKQIQINTLCRKSGDDEYPKQQTVVLNKI